MNKRPLDDHDKHSTNIHKKHKHVVAMVEQQKIESVKIEPVEITIRNNCHIRFGVTYSVINNILRLFSSFKINDIILRCDQQGILFKESNFAKTVLLFAIIKPDAMSVFQISADVNQFFNVNINTQKFIDALDTLSCKSTDKCEFDIMYDKNICVAIKVESKTSVKHAKFDYNYANLPAVQIPKELSYYTSPEMLININTSFLKSCLRLIESKSVTIKCTNACLSFEWKNEDIIYETNISNNAKCIIINKTTNPSHCVNILFDPSALYSACKHIDSYKDMLEESTTQLILSNNRPASICGTVGDKQNVMINVVNLNSTHII